MEVPFTDRVILCAVGHIALGARSGTWFPMSVGEPCSWAFAGWVGLGAWSRGLLENDWIGLCDLAIRFLSFV